MKKGGSAPPFLSVYLSDTFFDLCLQDIELSVIDRSQQAVEAKKGTSDILHRKKSVAECLFKLV